ncbi:MAG TPA: type VI secretion system protein TssA [Geminicoccaceae bacterium]|nr:type VI secretion system protein TssA [Geminicoccus sp.]HMU49038.1 type VI secretion system protein TssA [Geminicoccaceae bacterium]
MARDEPFDIVSLLAPIAGASPAGLDVRYEGDHDRIREARRADDPALPQGVWRHEPKRADWAAVEALGVETLRKRSKDLQVAAWVAEAFVHRRGFRGLVPGMGLLRELCDRFWDDLHPAFEDGDPAARIAPLVWLNERLPAVLSQVPITAGPEERPYSLADHERAQRLDTIRTREPKAAEKAEAGGAVTSASFAAELAATPDGDLRAILAAIEAGTAEIVTLERLLDRHLGREAPGLGAVRGVLQDIGGLVATALRGRPSRLVEATSRLVGVALRAAPVPRRPVPAAHDAPPPSAIATREDAYGRLAEVAAFLAENEPHSPVVTLLRHALEWGAMPLDQLVLTISNGRRDAPALFELLGLFEQAADGTTDRRYRESPVENSTSTR